MPPFKPVGPVHPNLRFTNLLKSFVVIIGDQEAVEWRKGITTNGSGIKSTTADLEPPAKRAALGDGTTTATPIYTQLPGDALPQDRIEVTRPGEDALPIKIILTLDPQPAIFKLTSTTQIPPQPYHRLPSPSHHGIVAVCQAE